MSTIDSLVERPNPLSALVVDCDDLQRQRIEAELCRRGVRTVGVGTPAAARASLHADLALLIVSTTLPGAGSVPQLVRAARRCSPLVECVIVRNSSETPLVCLQAVHDLVQPLQPDAFDASVRSAGETQAAMRAVTTLLIGRVGLKEAQRVLRAGMSQAALIRCAGSRRAAAALLGVDRRYVQKLCAEREAREAEEHARLARVTATVRAQRVERRSA